MATIFRRVIRGALLSVACAGCVVLLAGAVNAQGVGMPGIGVPGAGIGNPTRNLPQRQTPMAGGGAGGVPGQMNQRMGGAGMRPGQGPGFAAPAGNRSRGAGFAGVQTSASAYSGMARGGGIQRSSQGMSNISRNVGAPGLGNVGRRR
jgi:hypothetical protein